MTASEELSLLYYELCCALLHRWNFSGTNNRVDMDEACLTSGASYDELRSILKHLRAKYLSGYNAQLRGGFTGDFFAYYTTTKRPRGRPPTAETALLPRIGHVSRQSSSGSVDQYVTGAGDLIPDDASQRSGGSGGGNYSSSSATPGNGNPSISSSPSSSTSSSSLSGSTEGNNNNNNSNNSLRRLTSSRPRKPSPPYDSSDYLVGGAAGPVRHNSNNNKSSIDNSDNNKRRGGGAARKGRSKGSQPPAKRFRTPVSAGGRGMRNNNRGEEEGWNYLQHAAGFTSGFVSRYPTQLPVQHLATEIEQDHHQYRTEEEEDLDDDAVVVMVDPYYKHYHGRRGPGKQGHDPMLRLVAAAEEKDVGVGGSLGSPTSSVSSCESSSTSARAISPAVDDDDNALLLLCGLKARAEPFSSSSSRSRTSSKDSDTLATGAMGSSISPNQSLNSLGAITLSACSTASFMCSTSSSFTLHHQGKPTPSSRQQHQHQQTDVFQNSFPTSSLSIVTQQQHQRHPHYHYPSFSHHTPSPAGSASNYHYQHEHPSAMTFTLGSASIDHTQQGIKAAKRLSSFIPEHASYAPASAAARALSAGNPAYAHHGLSTSIPPAPQSLANLRVLCG